MSVTTVKEKKVGEVAYFVELEEVLLYASSTKFEIAFWAHLQAWNSV